MINKINARILQAQKFYTKAKNVLSQDKRKDHADFTNLRQRYYQNYWKNVAKGLDASLEDIGQGFFRINKDDQSTYVNHSEVMLDDHLSLKIAGNKPLTHKLLSEVGYIGPKYISYTLGKLDDARQFMESLDTPVVVKPASATGAGNGVTTEIRTYKQLEKASIFASAINKNLLIEEQVEGGSFRLLYLNGEFIDAIRRDQPVLTGDGSSTISQLVKLENIKRTQSEVVTALSPLTIIDEMRTHLSEQGLSLSSIPEKGRVFTVKRVVNENSSNENHIVRDQVHSSIINLGSELTSILDLKLVGVDLITPDISVPLKECGGVINELNTTPGLHHHDLVFEKDQVTNVGEQIIDYIFHNKNL